MKLRLFVVYLTEGAHVPDDVDLFTLTEEDSLNWLVDVSNIDTVIKSIKRQQTSEKVRNDACKIILEGSARIRGDESVHIVGDFTDYHELIQWLQMQDLLGNLDFKTIHTLTK